ncbi:polymorphic toxin-type HINT domain-containing protein [Acinetobacter boissieri]|uniref:Pretoxin HINT domain-containing protein n=1 Tax=Acinetobacter boissieri TaxID=1219383 RepID=A0A1G6JSM4_9GAMM|nr:polymorphic toxin-type HINT domain-containing protein [Acinetobacter boissieri]SDC21742.1 Pretoxin HINT domain-containing protein [Acinetobacter boissieri]
MSYRQAFELAKKSFSRPYAIVSAVLYFMAGKAAYDFGFELGKAIYGLMTATCWKDLDPIADKFAEATRALAIALAAGVAGKVAEVGPKINSIFNKIRSTLGEYQQKFGSQTLKRYDDMAREFVQKRVGGDAAGARKLCDCCFIAGTLVWTPAGLKPIENIQRGEQVYSLSDQSQEHGQPELKAVVDTIITPPKVTYRIHYGYGQTSGDIQASDNHPFFIQNRGWLNTLQLQPGMKLVDAQHHEQTIRSITVDRTPVTTYNLTVLDDHTFFVGQNKVWVHNAGKKCACRSENEEIPKLSDDPKDSLSKKGLNEPVRLTPAERETVEKWAALRFKYIKKVEKEDYSVIQDPILRQAITKAENSIRNSITADDLAAILKESRTPPVKITNENGKIYDHINEGEGAYLAISKALLGVKPERPWLGSNIKKRLGELEKRNQTDSAEYQLLQSKEAELTGLINKYVEYAPEVLNRINQRKNNE